MSILKCELKDKTLKLVNYPTLTAGSKGVDTLQVVLDDTWNDIPSDASFIATFSNGGNPISVNLQGDATKTCSVPNSILSEPGEIKFNISAVKDSDVIKNSSIIIHYVKPGIVDGSSEEESIDLIVQVINEHFDVNIPTTHVAENIPTIPTYSDGYSTAKAEDDIVIEDLNARIEVLENDKPTIVNAINNHFEVSIPTTDTASQAAEKIVEIPTFEQGYEFTRQLKEYVENYSIGAFFQINQTQVSADKVLRLPYLHTMHDKFQNQGTQILNQAIVECGIDISNNGPGNMPIVHKKMKKISITGMADKWNPYQTFQNLTDLTEFYFDVMSSYNPDVMVLSTFYGCSNLKKIGGCYYDETTKELIYDDENYGIMDFSTFGGVRTDGNFLGNCAFLEEIRIARKGIPFSFYFKDTISLSKVSVLSIVNGLDETKTGQKLTMHIIVKNKMNDWYAKYDAENDIYISCDQSDDGATAFSNIVALKGWVLA